MSAWGPRASAWASGSTVKYSSCLSQVSGSPDGGGVAVSAKPMTRSASPRAQQGQGIVRLCLDQADLHAGVSAGKLRQRGGKFHRGERRERGDLEPPRAEFRMLVQRAFGVVQTDGDGVGVLQERLACGRELRDASGTHGQRHAGGTLEGAQVMRDGGFGDVERAGGGGLGPVPGHGAQNQEAFNVDHQTIISLRSRCQQQWIV